MGDDPVINGCNLNAAIDLAATLQQAGEDGRADTLLRRSLEFIESQREDLRDTSYREEPAEIYALRGMVPEALAALRRAIDLGWRRGWWRARHKPHYESLRGEPEFEAMMAELEAETETMRRGPGASDTGVTRDRRPYADSQTGQQASDMRCRFQWNAPIRISPHDPDAVYHASQYVHALSSGRASL